MSIAGDESGYRSRKSSGEQFARCAKNRFDKTQVSRSALSTTLIGFDSGAALATVVGVLIEVPVMLPVVKVVNASKGWYEAGRRV